MATTGTVDHNYAGRDAQQKRMNAYDQHPMAVARLLRGRDTLPWKAATPENAGAVITNVTLSGSTVAGSSAVDTTVGTFAAVGGKSPWTMTLGDPSGKFKILAGVLKTKVTPITAGTYNVTCNVVDASGQAFNKSFAITVT